MKIEIKKKGHLPKIFRRCPHIVSAIVCLNLTTIHPASYLAILICEIVVNQQVEAGKSLRRNDFYSIGRMVGISKVIVLSAYLSCLFLISLIQSVFIVGHNLS